MPDAPGRPNSVRSDADIGAAVTLRAVEGVFCQISRPCPEKLSAPEPVRRSGVTGVTRESDGGNPITDVRGCAVVPCTTNDGDPDALPAAEVPKFGVRTTAFPVAVADVDPGCSDCDETGGVVTGACAGGAECEGAAPPDERPEPDECEPPPKAPPEWLPPNPPPPICPPPPWPPPCWAKAEPGAKASTAKARITAAKFLGDGIERVMSHLANPVEGNPSVALMLHHWTLWRMARLQTLVPDGAERRQVLPRKRRATE